MIGGQGFKWYIKILVVCVCALQNWDVWGTELDWWCTTFVLMMCDLRTYCTLYCMCIITSAKQTQSGAAAEGDTNGEQQLKQTQLGSSSWNRCYRGAVQSGHVRLVLAGDDVGALEQGATLDSCRCGEDLWSICLQWRENCNANGGKSSSDLCTVRELQAPYCLRSWMRGQ